jgi:hypothetical protein
MWQWKKDQQRQECKIGTMGRTRLSTARRMGEACCRIGLQARPGHDRRSFEPHSRDEAC